MARLHFLPADSVAGFEVVRQVGDLLVCQWFVLGLVLCWLHQVPYINVVRGVSLCAVLVAILVNRKIRITSEKYV